MKIIWIRPPREINLERAIDEVGEKVSEEIDEAALNAAFEEELETSLEAALLADAADTSALDDDAASNADDEANDSDVAHISKNKLTLAIRVTRS